MPRNKSPRLYLSNPSRAQMSSSPTRHTPSSYTASLSVAAGWQHWSRWSFLPVQALQSRCRCGQTRLAWRPPSLVLWPRRFTVRSVLELEHVVMQGTAASPAWVSTIHPREMLPSLPCPSLSCSRRHVEKASKLNTSDGLTAAPSMVTNGDDNLE